MAEERKFIRHIVVYADYFKEFRKTLPREVLRKTKPCQTNYERILFQSEKGEISNEKRRIESKRLHLY